MTDAHIANVGSRGGGVAGPARSGFSAGSRVRRPGETGRDDLSGPHSAGEPDREWAEHFDLYRSGGDALLGTDEVPLLRALRGEHVRDAEILIRATAPPARIVRCNGEPVRAADGTLLSAVCVMHDVTRLKAAEDTAQLGAERFADAFAAEAQGMALVSLEGRWLDANDALCEMFGYSRDELLTIDFQRLTHPDDLQSDLDLVGDLLRGRRQSYQLEKRYFHRTGTVIHAQLSVSLVHDAMGRPLHFVSQMQDFTSATRPSAACAKARRRSAAAGAHVRRIRRLRRRRWDCRVEPCRRGHLRMGAERGHGQAAG